jgi:hypothetical protein
MPLHDVAQGDCLLSIAEQYGFFWETLWEHPRNAELKQTRKRPCNSLSGRCGLCPRQTTESCIAQYRTDAQVQVKKRPRQIEYASA